MRLVAARDRLVRLLPILAWAWAAACGRPPAPAQPSPPEPAATFTITSLGVTPKSAAIALGGRVLFVNNDTRTHSIASDPHPDETDCPNLNQVGFLRPGEKRESGNFVVVRDCGFHDHDSPFDQTLMGTVTTQ
jgi:plastocyanin